MGGNSNIGEIKDLAVSQTRKISITKKSMKIYNFLKMLKKILLFFEKCLEILTKLSQKFREKFRIFWRYAFVVGSGGGAPLPEPSEIIKNLVEKSMEIFKCLKIFTNSEWFFI